MQHAEQQGEAGKVWLDLDQEALDSAYDQARNAENFLTVAKRMERSSAETRRRLGEPQVHSYGSGPLQKLYLYTADTEHAPIHVHVHGGAWRQKPALDGVFPAEHFLAAGVSFAIFDFASVEETDGDLRPMLDDVRACLAWLSNESARLGGDPNGLFLSGFSSGAHLAALALLTDWTRHGLSGNPFRGAVLASGMYDLHPVRLSSRSRYVHFTDEVEEMLSPQRHIDGYDMPLALLYGDCESPEFQRQTRDFAAALHRAGKPATLTVERGYNHLEILESLGNPFGPFGRAALEQIRAASRE